MGKCSVVTRDRTVILNDDLTIGQAKERLAASNQKLSLKRTLQLYGLTYVEDRSFTSKYRDVFGLSSSKTLYDIKLKEIRKYRDLLVGMTVRR